MSVVVNDGTHTSTVAQQLQYDNTNTPYVSSINPSSGLSVLGGETITIDGFNFNLTKSQVFFGNNFVPVKSYNSTKIIITSPSLNPGKYDLIIPVGNLGNAK